MIKKEKFYKYELNINFLNCVSIIIALLLVIIFKNNLSNLIKYTENISDIIIIFILIILWLMFHELLHGIAYYLTGTKRENISYGIALEKGVFYCLSNQEIKREAILISLLTPLVTIGITTLIISLMYNLPLLTLLSILNIIGSSGDIIMFYDLLKLDKYFKYTEIGDPTSFLIITKQDISKIKLPGLKPISNGLYKQEKRDIQKISISNQSIVIIFLLIIIFGIIYLVG